MSHTGSVEWRAVRTLGAWGLALKSDFDLRALAIGQNWQGVSFAELRELLMIFQIRGSFASYRSRFCRNEAFHFHSRVRMLAKGNINFVTRVSLLLLRPRELKRGL